MFDLEKAVTNWRDDLEAESALSRSDVDELEDHLRLSYEAYVAAGIQSATAFQTARQDIGTPAELVVEFSKIEDPLWHRLLVAGWSAFLVSFFLPVHEYSISLFNADVFSGELPGFEAFVFALTDGGVVGVLSALTNLVMIATMWRIADRGRDRILALFGLVAAATLLNLWWMTDGASALRMGYYLWVASFGSVAGGLALRARDLGEEAAPVAAD